MKLTQRFLSAMPPGSVMTLRCGSAAELDAATQTAYKARRRAGNGDLKIRRSAVQMEVTIVRPGDADTELVNVSMP